jgi:hypothetical protein
LPTPRMAALSPVLSPPEVRIPIRLFFAITSLCLRCSVLPYW